MKRGWRTSGCLSMGTRILSLLHITGPSGSGSMSGFFSLPVIWNKVLRTRLISAAGYKREKKIVKVNLSVQHLMNEWVRESDGQTHVPDVEWHSKGCHKREMRHRNQEILVLIPVRKSVLPIRRHTHGKGGKRAVNWMKNQKKSHNEENEAGRGLGESCLSLHACLLTAESTAGATGSLSLMLTLFFHEPLTSPLLRLQAQNVSHAVRSGQI